jgi:hypothetical protein
LMAIVGAVLLMARYKAIQPKFAENWEEEYKVGENVETESKVNAPVKKPKAPRARKVVPEVSTAEADAEAAKIRMDKLLGRRPTGTKESSPRAKKSS